MDNTDFTKKLKELIIEAKATAQGAREEDSRRRISMSLGTEIANMLAPFLSELASTAKANKEEMREMAYELASAVNAREMAGIDTEPIVRAIQQTIGGMRLPEPKVTVMSPKVDIPKLMWPEGDMPITGWVRLMGVSMENPLPVQIRDAKGRPVNLDLGTIPLGGGSSGGGKSDFFTIKGFSQSAYAELMNADGRLRVSVETGGSGLTDSELRATAVPVSQVSGANWSVAVIDIFGSTAASSVFNADNRIKVSVETGGSGLTDSELRATAVPVAQVSGASWSTAVVSVSDIFSTTSASVVVNPDNRVRVELPDTTVTVTGTLTSTGAYLLNGDGTYRDTVPVSGTLTVSSVTASTAASIVDSGGVQYSGSNPLPVALISGALTSTVAVGAVVSDAVDDGSAPVKRGGIARTANPTAVAGGDVVTASHDDLGRTLIRPIQVRDLTLTAYASLTNGTETTLRAAVAGAYLDLVYIMGANNSDVAVTVDIRPVTAGNIVMTLQIPASGTAGIACPVPLPQSDTGNNWTADMGDITGTTVYLTALFSQEI